MTPRDEIDWKSIERAQASAVSGVAIRVDAIEKAIDKIGGMLARTTGETWEPISHRWACWPDENDPVFRKGRT